MRNVTGIFCKRNERHDYPNIWGICCTMSQTIQHFSVTLSSCYVSVVFVSDWFHRSAVHKYSRFLEGIDCNTLQPRPQDMQVRKIRSQSNIMAAGVQHTRWHHLTWQATRLLRFCPSLKSSAFLSCHASQSQRHGCSIPQPVRSIRYI